MSGNQIVFLLMALVALVGAIGVVAFGNNPVRAALFLVLNFFMLGFLYFGLGAQLLGITQIMVYAGAIMVLFLFVIMVLQLHRRDAIKEQQDIKKPLAWLFGLALGFGTISTVLTPLGMTGSTVTDDFGRPTSVGLVLFSTYSWPFEVTSVLLLIGIVGSILLAKRRI